MDSNLEIKKFHFNPFRRTRLTNPSFEISVDNLTIESGRITTIVGPSGSGKSTLFNLLAGVIESQLKSDVRCVFPTVAYLMHDSVLLPWKSVCNNYLAECKLRQIQPCIPRFKKLIKSFELPGSVLDDPVRSLSFGMRQRVELARAIAVEANLLIVDEGLSGLDRGLKRKIISVLLQELASRKMAILFTSHFLLDVVTFSDRIVCIKNGMVSPSVIAFDCPIKKRLRLNELDLLGDRKVAEALAVIAQL
jgi:NitT/TauT family transport system ATP-binding protein